MKPPGSLAALFFRDGATSFVPAGRASAALALAAALCGAPAPAHAAAGAPSSRGGPAHRVPASPGLRHPAPPPGHSRVVIPPAALPAHAATRAPAPPGPALPGGRPWDHDEPKVPRGVSRAIAAAHRATGVPAAWLMAMAWAESRLDPGVGRSASTTARGLFQFTDDAWLTAIRTHGARHGMAGVAAAIRTDPLTGAISVPPRLRRHVMALRDDPSMSAMMAAENAAAALAEFPAARGRPGGLVDADLLHLLGRGGAQAFFAALERAPGKPCDEVIPSATRNNPGVFMRGGRALSVAEAYSSLGALLDMHGARYGEPTVEVAQATGPR